MNILIQRNIFLSATVLCNFGKKTLVKKWVRLEKENVNIRIIVITTYPCYSYTLW